MHDVTILGMSGHDDFPDYAKKQRTLAENCRISEESATRE
jgi:hypothetical protein